MEEMMQNRKSGPGLVEYSLILIAVAVVVIGLIACFWAFMIPIAWPWLSTVVFPWFVGVIAGVQRGDPASIALLVVIILVAVMIFFPRSSSSRK